MEHFLAKIIKANGADLSNDVSVHSRFVKYSKGDFQGPACAITRRGKAITVKATVDYEDVCGLLVLGSMQADEVTIDGNITTFENPDKQLAKTIPQNKKDTVVVDGKRASWVITISGSWRKNDVQTLYNEFQHIRGYILLKISNDADKGCSMTVKSKVPQNKGEFNLENALKFATAKLPNTQQVVEIVLDSLLPDFKKGSENFKEIMIENYYKISDITIPPAAQDKRLSAIRHGMLKRKIHIDGKELASEFKIMV